MSKKKKGEAWGENGFEDWGGYMAAKQTKLEEQFRLVANKEFKDSTNILEGIAIFVNGYTDPSADVLRRLMMAHGGIYHHYLRPKATTHIIASNLPYNKIVLYRKSQNPMPICKPEWIVDSINAGRLLNFQNYLLYSNCTDTQPQLKYKKIDEAFGSCSRLKLHDNPKKDNDNNANDSPNDNDNANNTIESTATDQEASNPSSAHGTKGSNSTKNPEFISEFYSHSRLHHISTMGATFKNYVNELRDKSDGKFPGLAKLKESGYPKLDKSFSDSQSSFRNDTFDLEENNKAADDGQGSVIMHIDMDCFFVSVGLRNKPELKGLPVAVTHAKGNRQPAGNDDAEDALGSLSEIASCSYEARKAGVKNGMFLGEALKICPNLKTMPYDFDGYTEVSYALYDTVASYTLDIEAVSCDEMYADCTKILEECSLTPLEFAGTIRREIKEKTGCPVSTGFGSNKLLARLATRMAKPDGQFHLKQSIIESCIGVLDVQDLPGVGWTTTNKLHSMNVRTCAELRTVSSATLQKEFGRKMGEVLYNMCRGVDRSRLNLEHIRKSVSAEVNYGIRFEKNDDAIDFLKKLSVEVAGRLRNANARGRCIALKLLIRAKEAPKETAKFMGHGQCDYMTKSKNLIASIDDPDIIAKEAITLWNQMLKVPEDARGIGIQVTRLEILKSKSRDRTLKSFVTTKSKETGASKEFARPSSTSVPSTSSNTIDDQRNVVACSRVDEAVLAEFPDDVRNEIVDVQRNEGNGGEEASAGAAKIEKKSGNRVQTIQENFFKQSKPSVSRPAKVEMPPLQEIDMAVLIELPEDIRNEILNEYSGKRSESNAANDAISGTGANGGPTTVSNNGPSNRDENNISFSQVDPEFLAALSDDMRREVEHYCTAKKAGQSSKINEEQPGGCKVGGGSVTRGNNVAKGSKKVERKTKNSGKSLKATSSRNDKSKRKGILDAFKVKQSKTECESIPDRKDIGNGDNGISKCILPSLSGMGSAKNDRVTGDEAEAILSHNRTISEDNESSIQHQDILIDLVNRLLNLPLEQVKMQIQIWIVNSKIVNEVDFLSLATFLSMLPEKRRIEDLHILLKTMHRCMTKTGNCIWHRTYRKTVKYVQHYMQIEYNSNLIVPPIKCNHLQCNNDI